MSFSINRGPSVSVNLFFDGSVSPNPGPAGWGAVAIVKTRGTAKTLQWSAPVGDTTNNVAEYLGLIGGLRRLIIYLQSHSIRHSYVNLKIHGDSQLVINQLTGRAKVKSEQLAPLHHIASQLVSHFLNVQFNTCSREKNATADRLANQARQKNVSAMEKAIYYPALLNFADAWVEDVCTLASHDLGTAGSDPSCFIDATFLHNLPQGEALLRSIRDPHPLSIVIGKVNMTVLGTVTLELGVAFSRLRNGQPRASPEEYDMVDVVVVHALPVPIHISHRHPAIGRPKEWGAEGIKFAGENLPGRYSEHAYWHSDVSFLGYEDETFANANVIISARQLRDEGKLDENAISSISLQGPED